MDLKKDIRNSVLKKREILSEEEWDKNSRIIYEKVITHSFFLNAETIYCYIDYKKETATRMIIEKAWKLNKKVAVPKVVGMDMTFHFIQSFSDLEKGYKGILEPVTEPLQEIVPGLVILPGVSFDKKRNRIGYGKGYYDRFLSKHTSLKTMAIAFEMQIIDKIPSEPFDIQPQVLITERYIYV